jgi:tetratricopeptide (TPR) repeat protein
LRQQPGNLWAQENLLRIEVYEVQRDAAEKRIEAILSVDPRNALANFILGTLQVYNEDFALAESSFRQSLETKRSPDTLNSLAWVLYRRGAMEEALLMAKNSLAMSERSAPAWDTYGAILLALGRLDEAEEAFQKALALAPDTAEILLHTAQLYEKKGLLKEALRVSDALLARPAELSRESYDTLRDMVRRLRLST